MGITSLKNKVSKRIKNESLKTDFQEIGVFIKKRRKDLNLTQDIISNGICSVSYLSKIENGQISPNEYFVKEIMTKLEIEEDFLNKNLEDKSYLNKAIKCFFYMDMTGMEILFEEIKTIEDNLIINICKFGYLVSKFNRLNSDYVVSLENLVMNMSDLELKTYLLFSTLYFISHDDYKTALELLLMATELNVQNDYLTAMINEYLYYVKQRLLKKNCSSENFEEAYRIYTKYLNSERSTSIVLNRIKYLSEENPKQSLELLENVKTTLLKGFNHEFYQYLKARILFNLECYNEAVISLSNIKDDSQLFTSKMVLLYEICLLEEDTEMLEEIKSILKEFRSKKSDLKDKVYFHFLTQKDEENKKEYLRDIAIPFSIKTSDYHSLNFYIEYIMDICISNSRYKEATQYYKKYTKEISKVERILYSK